MIQKLINLFRTKQSMQNTSDLLEEHPALQARLEMIEDWLEEQDEFIADLGQRLNPVEEMAHPKCGIEEFDGYEPLVDRIKALEEKHD